MSIETITYKGFDINIHYDKLAENPREAFDGLGKIACVENWDYTLGDTE